MKYSLLLSFFFLSFTAYTQQSQEICGNGIDDDADGLIDCEDPDAYCEFITPNLCNGEQDCNNGIDDDGDGTIDYYDSDCHSDPNNPNEYIVARPACEKSPGNVSFEAEPAWDSNLQTSAALGMPSVADLDQDGFPEVISMNSETGWLYILDGRTGSILNQVRVKAGQVYAYPTVGDVDGDGFGEIFTIDLKGVIRAYEHDLTLKWTQTSTFTGFGRHLGLADFNHDGKAELYYVNEIRDAETGTLLIEGSHGTSKYPSANNWATELNAVPVAVDISPSSGLELALGHIIYTVSITNTGGTSSNSLTEAMNMDDTGSLPIDYIGYFPADVDYSYQNCSQTSVADYNQDGNLDVLIGGANGGIDSITTAFFWDIANDAVKTFRVTRSGNTIPGMTIGTFSDLDGNTCDNGDECYWERGMGSISIADIDGDGQLEATFSSGSSLYALETDFTEKWSNHNDFWESSSGTSGITTYDFDGDGSAEILYRDEIDLHIIDGTTGLPLNEYSGTFCSSQTQVEYPIIADVDGDGETEIILSCGQSQNIFGEDPATSPTRTNGFIRAYKASEGNNWTPARKIWNQFAYFNTNVNDDLSIPRYQQAHHLNFAQTCSDPNAPAAFALNKFLTQSPKLNHCGQPTFAAAKLDFANEGAIVFPPSCTESSQEVRLIFENTGDKTETQPIPISFYAANPTDAYSNTDNSPYLETIYLDVPGGLVPGQKLDTTIRVNAIHGEFELFASLNDIGQKDEYGSPVSNEDFYPLTELNGSVDECDETPTIISKTVSPAPFEVKAVKLKDNRNCTGEVSYNNGEIQVLRPDDTPFPSSEYNFSWTNISTDQVIGNDALVTGLDSGTYQIVVENTTYGCFSHVDTIRVDRFEDWPDTQVISLEELQPVSSCAPGTADGIARVLINGTPVDESEYDIGWEDEQQAGVLAVGDTATNLKPILYKVTVTNKLSGCSDSETIDMTLDMPVMDSPLVQHNTSCDTPNGSITAQLLSGNPADYEYILIGLNPVQDTVFSTNPSFENLVAGIYEIRVFDPLTECGRYSEGIEVEITDHLPSAEFSYNQSLYCQDNAHPVPIMTTSGGTFSATPSGLVLNASSGEIDLAASVPGNYTVTYTIATSAGCPSDAQSFVIDIVPVDDASFSFDQPSYCQSEANPVAIITGNTGGTFTSTPDLVINTITGEIDLTNSAAGVYTITYTSSGACPASASVVVEINEVPLVTSLTASEITQNGFSLSWDNIPQANNYLLELDDDPSFASIDASGNIAHTDTTFFSLSSGTTYAVRVAAVGACGTGPFASLNVTTAVDPLVSDSLALVALYHATDGDNWNRNDNWLSGPLDTWYGIAFDHNIKRVYRIFLNFNNLRGKLPKELNELTKLDNIQLTGNFINAFPDSLFHDNSQISGWIRKNDLTFEDFADKNWIPFHYDEQNKIGRDTTVYVKEGDSYTIELGIDELVLDNEYRWGKDKHELAVTNTNSYTIADLKVKDSGIYNCYIINPRVPYLNLFSFRTTLHVIPQSKQSSLMISKKESCLDETITFSASGRNSLETYSWRLLNEQGLAIGLPGSLRTAQSFNYSINQPGTYSVELTLSNNYDADTVLFELISVHDKPEITLPESLNLDSDSLALSAVDTTQADISSLQFTWYKVVGFDTTLVEGGNTLWIDEQALYTVKVTNSNGCVTYDQVFVINNRPEAQTITFETITDKTYGDEAFELNATASSDLPITYDVIEGQELVNLSDYTVNILGVGTISIQASQNGNGQHLAAEPVIQSFNITKAPQHINFTAIPDLMLKEGGFGLEASSSVGLPLTFSASGPIVMSGKDITLLDTGFVSITASQLGNENYLPAEAVAHTFSISEETITKKDSIHQLSINIDTESNHVFPLKLNLYQKQNGVYKLISQKNMLSNQLSFDTLSEGIYTLKIKPENRLYLPTYFGQQLLLSEAEEITLTGDTDVSLHPVSIPDVLEELGITISGVFMQSTQVSNGRLMVTKETLDGIPVVGLTIFLIDAQDQSIVATTVTDGDGGFEFTHIPPGTYSIKADHKALPMDASTSFEVGQQSLALTVLAGEEVSIIAKEEVEEQVTGIENEIMQQLKFYPNPVVDELYLQVPVALIGAQLEIFDTHGRSVFTSFIKDTKVSCSLAKLSSGHYQLQISQQGKTYSLKILKK